MIPPYTHGIFIGRFQPFHKGHYSVITDALREKLCTKIIVVVGSMQEKGTEKNPFSYFTRKKMILASCHELPVKVVGVPDHPDQDLLWVESVFGEIIREDPLFEKQSSILLVGEEWYAKLFEKKLTIKHVDRRLHISASRIREMITRSDQTWKALVPRGVVHVYETLKEGNL